VCLFCHGKWVDPNTNKCADWIRNRPGVALGGSTPDKIYCEKGKITNVVKGVADCKPLAETACATITGCLRCEDGSCK
jgi:hypothetical protein